MRVLVTGGRGFENAQLVAQTLGEIHRGTTPITALIHGAASGADQLAGNWARINQVKEVSCPADWGLHGRSAGSIRNRAMLQHNPDLVVAFPGGKDTADMVDVARRFQVKVMQIRESN